MGQTQPGAIQLVFSDSIDHNRSTSIRGDKYWFCSQLELQCSLEAGALSYVLTYSGVITVKYQKNIIVSKLACGREVWGSFCVYIKINFV